MSLYSLGVLFSEDGLELEVPYARLVHETDLEEEDQITVLQLVYGLRPELESEEYFKSWFVVADAPSEWEATGLWNQALTDQSLWETIGQIVNQPGVLVGALALFDGAIETVFYANPSRCLRYWASQLQQPWDNMDNPLVVWSNE
jgi:hypothetical protein